MTTSETDITNRALRLLKAQRITGLDDGSNNANVALDVYTGVREEVVRAHTWHFARRLVELAKLTTAPTFGFDSAYALPADWMRTVSLHDNDAGLGNVAYEEAEVAGAGALLCSVSNAFLRYVYDLTDANRMSADCRTAFAYALAVQMPGISNISSNGWDRLEKEARKRMTHAKSTDSLGSPSQQRPSGSWVTSRNSWPSTRWPR